MFGVYGAVMNDLVAEVEYAVSESGVLENGNFKPAVSVAASMLEYGANPSTYQT